MAKAEQEDPTTQANVFPRENLSGDNLLYKPRDDSKTKRPRPAPIVNIHKEYEANKSYHKTRQTIKEIISQHKAKALSNQERYEREQAADKYKTNFLETRLATTGVPTLNDISVVMNRRHAQGKARMKGIISDTPTFQESLKIAMHRSYGNGKLDIKSFEIDELPRELYSTFMLQMARFITEINVSRNEFRTLSKEFCLAYPGCQCLNASENHIMTMAPEISKWSNLITLVLDSNRLTGLPDKLPLTLTTLSLARNRLTNAPHIHRLKALTCLDISHNQFTTLPNAMYELKYLSTFSCQRNQLVSACLLPMLSTHGPAEKSNSDQDNLEMAKLEADKWTISIDPDTNDPIYFNSTTKEVTRVCPPGLRKEIAQSPVTTPNIPPLQLPNSTLTPMKSKANPKKGWEIETGIPIKYTNHTTNELFFAIPKELDRYDAFVVILKRLNLSSNCIQELPLSMGEMHQLEYLNIEHNQLATLPDSICQLRVLHTLQAGSNWLTTLPKTLPLTPSLKELDLKLNRLTDLPTDIGKLTTLTNFDVSGNKLTTIPPSILQLTKLRTFNVVGNPNLKVPSASSQKNGLQAIFWEIKHQIHIDAKGLPPETHQVVGGIGNECVSTDIHIHKEFLQLVDDAKASHVLDYHWKQLQEVPFQLFQVTTLLELRLTGHVLRHVPKEISMLTSLRILTLRRNQLVEFHEDCIPETCSWEELDCENNQISILPDTFKRCTKLKFLRMGCNVLETLPSCMGDLKNLEHCYLAHNHLHGLPSSISNIEKLEILDVSNNMIEDLSSVNFELLPNLKELKANLNLLFDLPDSIAHSNLHDLSLSGNRFKVYPAAGTKFKYIKRIWMQANKLAELPVEFGNLRTLEVAEFEGNPLRSPPPEILVQGVLAIHQYLQKRIGRVHEMKTLLTAAQYGYHEDNFTPRTHDLLHSGILFLLKEDLIAFDKKIDQYINGPFYEHPDVRGVDLVENLVALQFKRSQASRLAVLEDLLKLCELIQAKRWLDKVDFRYDLTRPWGQNGEDTLVFMIDPKPLYNDWEDVPSILTVIKKRVERGFKDEAFVHSQEVVEDALTNYKGVYGPIGLVTERIPFRCGCEELLRKKTQHDPCYRYGWILIQMLITPEEAARRQREQEHLTQALSQVRSEIELFCSNTRDGKKRLLKEAKTLKTERKKKMKLIKKQIPQIKRKIELRKADLDIAIKKHAVDKSIAGDGWIEEDEKHAKFREDDIQDDINRMNKQIQEMMANQIKIKHELRQDYKHYVAEIVEKLLLEAGAEVRERILKNHRIKAIRKQYRRPWDGPNGLYFNQFKQEYLGLPPLESPRDNSSISDVSGDFDDYADGIGDDSDESLASIVSSSVSDDVEVAKEDKQKSDNDSDESDI